LPSPSAYRLPEVPFKLSFKIDAQIGMPTWTNTSKPKAL
jgi:hypothetical protein